MELKDFDNYASQITGISENEYIRKEYIYQEDGFSHFTEWRRFWEYFIIFVGIFPLFEISFIYFIFPNISIFGFSPSFIFDIFFIMDYFILINTYYSIKGGTIKDSDLISDYYGRFGLGIQIISSIPLSWIGIILNNPNLYLLLSINKIFRTYRSFRAYLTTGSQLPYLQGSLSVLPILYFFLFGIHVFSCLLILIARIEGYYNSWLSNFAFKGYSTRRLYIISVYFVMTTVTTIGTGDILPSTNLEIGLIIILQIIGCFIQASLTAKLVTVLRNPLESEFMMHYQVAQDYIHFKEVQQEIRKEVNHFSQHQWLKTHGTGGVRNMLKHLPNSTRNRIKYELTHNIFEQSICFNSLQQNQLLKIATIIYHITFSPGDIISKQGDDCTFILLLESGIVQVIIDNNPVASYSCDDGFIDGENQMLTGTKRNSTMKCLTYLTAWVLKKEDLTNLLLNRKKLLNRVVESIQLAYPFVFENIVQNLFPNNFESILKKIKNKQAKINVNHVPKSREKENHPSISKFIRRNSQLNDSMFFSNNKLNEIQEYYEP